MARLGSILVWALLAGNPAAAEQGESRNTPGSGPLSQREGPSSLTQEPGAICQQPRLSSPLVLFEVIERALCESPKTRSAWMAVRAAAANVAMSKAAYLPTLQAGVQSAYQHYSTQVTRDRALETDYSDQVNQESLSLGWVLYDFGARAASVNNSRELLLAAQANKDATLQATFAETAKDYYSAQAADANREAKRRIEAAAHQTHAAAAERVRRGVAAITEEQQANTAWAQAVYERVKAEGDYRLASGALAIDMSLSPDDAFVMPQMDLGATPAVDFIGAVQDLLMQAQKTHPKVLAAAAQWQAALANIRLVRSQGRPTLSMVGESDRTNQPASASLGQPEYPATTRQNYIGVQIKIPLFDGFGRQYQIRQAEAQAAAQEQAMRDAEQQVAMTVWSTVQTLSVDTENLRNTELVVRSASDAYDTARHRYESGAGNILDVLSSERALVSAEQQRIQSRLEWRVARLRLAASLGQIGMWAIE